MNTISLYKQKITGAYLGDNRRLSLYKLLFIHILANGSAAEARRAEKKTMVRTDRPGRGEPPAKADGNISPEGATECSATPSGFGYSPPIYRGFTPACGLNAPSGLPLGDVYKE